MGIVNRDLDPSQQKGIYTTNLQATATGVTLALGIIANQGTLDGVRVAANGVSGAPVWSFFLDRFIVGTGLTSIIAGFTSLTVTAYGTSGPQSVVTVAAGNTLLNVLTGDVLCVSTTGSNTAVVSGAIDWVVKATQDIKSTYGSST